MQKRTSSGHEIFNRTFTFGGYQWMAKKANQCGLNVSAVCREALITAIENAGGKIPHLSPRISTRGLIHGTAPKVTRRKRRRKSTEH